MGVAEELRSLIGELDSSISVLSRISEFYDEHVKKQGLKSNSIENAIIFSDVFVSFYTCTEG